MPQSIKTGGVCLSDVPMIFFFIKVKIIKGVGYVTIRYWGLEKHIEAHTWWRHQMETLSALLAICAGNPPVPGEFPSQRPVTRSFDVFFDLCLNKRLSKQSWGWWCYRAHYDVTVMSVEANTTTLQINVWLEEASQNVQNNIDPHNDIDLATILNSRHAGSMSNRCQPAMC